MECICHEGWKGPLCGEPICSERCVLPYGRCSVCIDFIVDIFERLTTAHLSYISIYVLNTMSFYDQKDTPGRCICEKGWSGDDCNICQPYPGCINGDCATIEGEKRPWTCTCNEGFEYGYEYFERTCEQ